MLTVYYWRRGFMMLAPSFALDREDHPYRRLSATLMVALGKPFTLQAGDGAPLTAHAALVAPKVPRRRIVAIDSHIAIFDLAVATPAFEALSPLLADAPVRVLDAARLEPLRPDFERAHAGSLDGAALRRLVEDVVFQLTGRHPDATTLDPRILRALERIDERRLSDCSLDWLAGELHLSPSRLRHLFAEQVGCSVTHYLRWAALWKAVWLWSRGRPLVEVVEEVGFHDLAHLNRTFNEVFGVNPSLVFDPQQFRLRRCDWN